MKKFALSHNLPVPSLITKSNYNRNYDEDVIIHISDSITHDSTTKEKTSYNHTVCGKNMYYVSYVDDDKDIEFAQSVSISNVYFCSRCGTPDEHIGVYEGRKVYDKEQRDIRIQEEAKKEEAREVAWNKAISAFEYITDYVLDQVTWMPVENRSYAKFFIKNVKGTNYRITVSIEEAE